VIIFINKMDREGRDPFELLDELEEKLEIKVKPLTWPVGIGADFQGVYNLNENKMRFFEAEKTKLNKDVITTQGVEDPVLKEHIGEEPFEKLKEDIELIEGVYSDFNKVEYEKASVAPVFFGSALNNFGVKEILDTFSDVAPHPQPRNAEDRYIEPYEDHFTGFVFKIHANLDPKHRDRIAFMRVCSGKFERNKFFYHVRKDKKMKFSNPSSFMAS
ncbi:MAG: GTP-binding protein, partial [Flavobacteriales bacterium]